MTRRTTQPTKALLSIGERAKSASISSYTALTRHLAAFMSFCAVLPTHCRS
jgi:hypothetical protein